MKIVSQAYLICSRLNDDTALRSCHLLELLEYVLGWLLDDLIDGPSVFASRPGSPTCDGSGRFPVEPAAEEIFGSNLLIGAGWSYVH